MGGILKLLISGINTMDTTPIQSIVTEITSTHIDLTTCMSEIHKYKSNDSMMTYNDTLIISSLVDIGQ